MTGTAVTGTAAAGVDERFAASRALFETTLGFLDRAQAASLEHAELETELEVKGRELVRQLMQDHLELRSQRERRLHEVVDAEQLARGSVETGHTRALTTVFGEVTVTRLAYRRRGHANLYPADAQLNLPVEKHSHGLRKLAAVEAARGSFEDTADAIERATGVRLGKRQVEELAGRAAVDVDDFYAQRRQPAGAGRDVLALSVDGKGIVMRPEALRPATAKAAASSTTKLSTRLSKGEKRNRKRLAEVGAVDDADPVVRTPADILARGEDTDPAQPAKAPVAKNKWLTASVTHDAATVVGRIFDEADRRDPTHSRTWIALVDGNNHQIDRIQAEATQHGIEVTILCDFIHVLEYLTQDPLFLQVKEATASVLEDHLPKSRYEQPGARVVHGQRMMQAVSDIFLGWTRGEDERRHFYWRLRDMKGSAVVEAMSPLGLTFYARACGWTLARAHARSGDPVAISEYLGDDDAFDRSLTDFSERYANQNEQDFQEFVKAVRSGRIEALEGV